VVISDVAVGALAALPCNGKAEVFGQTDAAGVLVPHDHANYGTSKTSKKIANDTSLEHHHTMWLQTNIISSNTTAFYMTGVPAVQMMRQARIPGSINISPDKATRYLARERRKINEEQDLCTFGGLHEYVHSLLMFSADNSDSFHSSFDTKAADAIHEMRFIHMDVEADKQRFVLVWSSVHLLLNLYRSQSPHLPHGGWLGCDTTHGLVCKFGTKEFLLSSFNTMDLKRRSHRVADMLSTATCSEDYRFGLKAVTDATRRVLRIHCGCATSQVPAPLDDGVEVVSAAGTEHCIHSASTASQRTEAADASSKPISAAGLLYQIAAGRNVDIGASPDAASFGVSILMSDNDEAIQKAGRECFMFGEDAMSRSETPTEGICVTQEFKDRRSSKTTTEGYYNRGYIFGNCTAHASRKFTKHMKKAGMVHKKGHYTELRSDLDFLTRFPFPYPQFQCALELLKLKWGDAATEEGAEGDTQTAAVISSLWPEYFTHNKCGWVQGLFPPGVSNSNQGLEGGFNVIKSLVHFYKRTPLRDFLRHSFDGVKSLSTTDALPKHCFSFEPRIYYTDRAADTWELAQRAANKQEKEGGRMLLVHWRDLWLTPQVLTRHG
jgi:hypothetical protein